MSTEVETKMKSHTMVIFWGGDERGRCVQITASEPLRLKGSVMEQIQEEGFIHLTMEEAAILCKELSSFVKSEALRRRDLLREQLADLKLKERTVFHEVCELHEGRFESQELCVQMVSKYCPVVQANQREGENYVL